MGSLLGTATYTVTRSVFAVVAHEPTRSTDSTFTIKASFQPINGREMDRLPEGQRSRASYKLIAQRVQPVLRVAGVDGVTAADRVDVDSVTYEVIRVEDWTKHKTGIPHRLYFLEQVGEDE